MNHLSQFSKKIEKENITEIFVKKLERITRYIYEKYYKKQKKLSWQKKNELDYQNSEKCHICKNKIGHC